MGFKVYLRNKKGKKENSAKKTCQATWILLSQEGVFSYLAQRGPAWFTKKACDNMLYKAIIIKN